MNSILRRRRAMMQKQDGGEDDLFKLLDTITLESATHSVDFQLADYATYDYIVVKYTTTLSASDYIYLRKDGAKTQKWGNKRVTHSGKTLGLFKIGSDNYWWIIVGASTSDGYLAQSAKPTSIGLEPYTSSVTFGVGSVFKVYGANLPS